MDELPSQSRRNLDHPGQRDDLGSVPDGYTAGSDPLRSTWDSDVPALTDDQPANASKSAARAAREIIETVLLAAVIFFGVRMLVLNFKVDGLSMMPNLQNHELLLVNRNAYEDIDLNHLLNRLPFVDREGTWVIYRFDPPKRGDIISSTRQTETTSHISSGSSAPPARRSRFTTATSTSMASS